MDIKPKKVPDDISSMFLVEIWNAMTKSMQKDIKELFGVFYIEAWTATLLMVYRILEEILRVHITHDLKETGVSNIGEEIEILRNKNYSQSFLEKLEYCKDERNDFMHGQKRANPKEAKEMVEYLM
ncbi:hypothetical protein AGMMS50267_03720 [Spirochaetia bacterium]|nr:hypothetical protein AGMMS50267_03720 [Spirochaetia bacterium]